MKYSDEVMKMLHQLDPAEMRRLDALIAQAKSMKSPPQRLLMEINLIYAKIMAVVLKQKNPDVDFASIEEIEQFQKQFSKGAK